MIKVIHSSKLDRAMKCPGSLFFQDLPPQPTNEAAEEGTAAGEYLERLLTTPDKTTIPTHARNGKLFDDEMKFYMTQIYDEIVAKAQSTVLCETKVDWMTRSGIIIAGKYDASFESEGKLFIDDLKYGYGIVEVKENWQLISYAIGEVMRRGKAPSSTVMRIRQPRPYHEDGPNRPWEISYEQLLEYKEQIETQMDKISQGFNDLMTGPQCRYCPAAAFCPASNKSFWRGVEYVESFHQDNMDEKEIAHQLDVLKRIGDVFKTRLGSIEQLAVDRIKSGKIIPNYAIEQSYGDRKWKPGISPEAIKVLTGKDVLETVMLSPAKSEKVGVNKDLVKELVERPFLGHKLKKKDHSKLGDKIFGSPT